MTGAAEKGHTLATQAARLVMRVADNVEALIMTTASLATALRHFLATNPVTGWSAARRGQATRAATVSGAMGPAPGAVPLAT